MHRCTGHCARRSRTARRLRRLPQQHWKEIQSTNPLERINREIKRLTDVVQAFPNPEAVLRLATAVPAEMHDEWIAFPRRYLSEESLATVYATVDTEALPGITEG